MRLRRPGVTWGAPGPLAAPRPALVASLAPVESCAVRDCLTGPLAYPSLGMGRRPSGPPLAGAGPNAAGPVWGVTVMALSCAAILAIGAAGESPLRARAGWRPRAVSECNA
ncbi:hypothetical protein QE392_003481 [Microbacterium proteolyticum]|nr:hypothetical protein [Microbacterium sp. SORGH_AS_0344]MDQ1171677.1 hypothetical protein [Microbacterium proteolyticum]